MCRTCNSMDNLGYVIVDVSFDQIGTIGNNIPNGLTRMVSGLIDRNNLRLYIIYIYKIKIHIQKMRNYFTLSWQ